MADQSSAGQRYSASEVSARTGLPDYVLKLWETQFPQLRLKEGSRQEVGYSANDMALIGRIKKLLYVDHMSIEKARKTLQWEAAFPVQDPLFMRPRHPVATTRTGSDGNAALREKLLWIIGELKSLRKTLRDS